MAAVNVGVPSLTVAKIGNGAVPTCNVTITKDTQVQAVFAK